METTSNRSAALLGQAFMSSKPEIVCYSDALAIGISRGNEPNYNEDAIGFTITDDNRTVVAIADGHWGAYASEYAVQESLRLLGATTPPTFNAPFSWFYTLFERINMALLDKALRGEQLHVPETSLIVAHIHQQAERARVYYASFGDSFLYVFSNNGGRQINDLRATWLGVLSALATENAVGVIAIPSSSGDKQPNEYRNVASGLEVGILDLHPHDTLLFATDGLPQCIERDVTTLSPNDLLKVLGGKNSAKAQCEALICEALELGGVDNIACAVYQQT